MLRWTPVLLGLFGLTLTGCASGRPQIRSLVDPSDIEISYKIGTTWYSHTFSLLSGGNPSIGLPVSSVPQKVAVIGQDQEGNSGAEYTFIIGPGAVTSLTSENWIEVDSGWVYVQIPHGTSPLWSYMQWPWVIGAGVRAGVSGYTSVDSLIMTNYTPGGGQLVVFTPTGSGSNVSTGKFRIGPTGTLTDVNPVSAYLVNGVSTSLTGMNLSTKAHIALIRDIADDYLP